MQRASMGYQGLHKKMWYFNVSAKFQPSNCISIESITRIQPQVKQHAAPAKEKHWSNLKLS